MALQSNRGAGLSQLIEELKRRNVIRVVVAYVVASWLVLQVADIVLQGIEAPAWVMKVFLLVLALGFPIVVLFSWAYELTPEGIKREQEVDRSQSITGHTGRKLNLITIAMLVAVLAVVVIERTMLPAPGEVSSVVHTTTATDKSIAVLAFEDLSPEGDQAYFADGLSEELLNVLAQVGDLKVAGRTSSFAFKGTNTDLREIGELLNVAHILEGSVRKAGDRIRVTAQLIKADDGFHLFSATYDRDLDDIFAVQDEIAQKISAALLTEIVGTQIEAVAQTSTEAYELYLMARQRIHTREVTAMLEAETMLGRAVEIDPEYAPALAQKALVTYLLSDSGGTYGDRPAGEALPAAYGYVDEALSIDGDLAEALAIKGLLLDNDDQNTEAIVILQRALALNPTMSDTANWLALASFSNGRPMEARRLLEDIVERDPTYGPAAGNLLFEYARSGEHDLAESLVTRTARIVGENSDVVEMRGHLAFLSGQSADAITLLGRSFSDPPVQFLVRLWHTWALLSIADFEQAAETGHPFQQMHAHWAMGDLEVAEEIAAGISFRNRFATNLLQWLAQYRMFAGSHQALVDQVASEIGSLDRLFELHAENRIWGSEFLGPLAYAYLQVGDEAKFRRTLESMGVALDLQAKSNPDNRWYFFNRAEQAALQGDMEAALSALETSIARGISFAYQLESPIFDSLRSEPRFIALEKQVAAYVDAERAKLGMPPYREAIDTNERPSFVN